MTARDKIEIYEGSGESDADEQMETAGPTTSLEDDEAKTVTFDVPRQQKARKQKPRRLTKRELSDKRSEKQVKDLWALTKPDLVKDKEHERLLRRIATQGVVQLFNAVAERQKTVLAAVDKKVKDPKLLSGANFDVNKRRGVAAEEVKEEDQYGAALKTEPDEEQLDF